MELSRFYRRFYRWLAKRYYSEDWPGVRRSDDTTMKIQLGPGESLVLKDNEALVDVEIVGTTAIDFGKLGRPSKYPWLKWPKQPWHRRIKWRLLDALDALRSLFRELWRGSVRMTCPAFWLDDREACEGCPVQDYCESVG